MKYLAVYSFDNRMKTAYAFDNHDDAVDYVNACTKSAGRHVREVVSVGEDAYRMTMRKKNENISISIDEFADEKIRYDLAYYRDGNLIEVRRFKNRDFAVNFATRILKNLGYAASEEENSCGEWKIQSQETDLDIELSLSLVVLNNKIADNDYEILGLSQDADIEAIKKAFRAMTDNPEKSTFARSAYERILVGSAIEPKKDQVRLSFENVDMRNYFKKREQFGQILSQKLATKLETAKIKINSAATKLMVRGVIEIIICAALTIAARIMVNDDRYIAFIILSLFGVINLSRGVYYKANPNALLQKD
jgi:hypothetical protein